MKITPAPPDPLAGMTGTASSAPLVRNAQQRAGQSQGAASPHADVTLSPQANLLAHAEQLMEKVPEIDWQRVAELRQAIQSGQFRVNPDKIADRLVSEVEHLLSQGR